jgi:hypothetical protein
MIDRGKKAIVLALSDVKIEDGAMESKSADVN